MSELQLKLDELSFSTNTRINEFKQQIQLKEEEIQRLKDQIRALER